MLSILVVDDEKIVISGIEKQLKLQNYPLKIYEAYDGEEAEEILAQNNLDILMTDIELPLMNGLDLIEVAKEYHPNIKTIVFSAYSNFEYARKAISLNAIYYLLKPINTKEFKEVLDTVIERCQREEAETDDVPTGKVLEEEMLFRDVFKNATLDESIVDNLSFFKGEIGEDTRFSLCYLKFNGPVLNEDKQKFQSFMKRNIKATYHIYKIDDTRCVVGFKYFASSKFRCYDVYFKITEWLKKQEKEENVFAVSAEDIESPILIYQEIEKIKHLEELYFYFNKKNVFLETDATIKTYIPTIDTKVFLDAIDRDIAEKNFISLQTNIEKLVEVLGINKQLSPMYVKYIFFDIITKIQHSIPAVQETDVSYVMERISSTLKVEELTESINPLIENLYRLDQTQYTHNRRIVEVLLDYIHHNYSKDLSLDLLAEMVLLSPAYTSTIFKQVTNQTITNYINDYRMKKAKRLLVETNMKLVNIYPLVGYSSLTYFCTLFKNMFGETPSQYRKKKKEEADV